MTVTDTGLDIHIERLIDAPIQVVFDEWLDPTARLTWYAPKDDWEVEARSDLRVGGAWFARFGPAAGEKWQEDGVYTVVDPPHVVSYTTRFTFPNGDSFCTQTTVTLSEVDGQTLLKLDDAGFPDETNRAAHEQGWPDFLDAFQRHLASHST